jgi:hypothetical protein
MGSKTKRSARSFVFLNKNKAVSSQGQRMHETSMEWSRGGTAVGAIRHVSEGDVGSTSAGRDRDQDSGSDRPGRLR